MKNAMKFAAIALANLVTISAMAYTETECYSTIDATTYHPQALTNQGKADPALGLFQVGGVMKDFSKGNVIITVLEISSPLQVEKTSSFVAATTAVKFSVKGNSLTGPGDGPVTELLGWGICRTLDFGP